MQVDTMLQVYANKLTNNKCMLYFIIFLRDQGVFTSVIIPIQTKRRSACELCTYMRMRHVLLGLISSTDMLCGVGYSAERSHNTLQ